MSVSESTDDRVLFGGGFRRVVGRLRYPEPPTPGTITGQTSFGERCVVLMTLDGVTLMGLAIAADFDRADERIVSDGPSSPAEFMRATAGRP